MHTHPRFTFEPSMQTPHFDVVSFTLDEAISQPFTLDLTLVSHAADIDFGQLIDKPALFTLWDGERPMRHVHGLVSRFSLGESGHHRTYYHALIEPQLARADLRSNWRIFQHKSVPQILETMLARQGITQFELRTHHEHAAREFCVQADETDLAFIARLAGEEGFVYRFEHTASQHKLVFCDRLLALGPLSDGAAQPGDTPHVDTVLYAANRSGDAAEPCLWRLSYSEQVRTTRQVQRDYTFRYPGYRQEHVGVAKLVQHNAAVYERFDYPGRYKRDAVGKAFVNTRAMGLQHDACIAQVCGDDARLQPGFMFALTEHPRSSLNTYWRVVSVTHEGSQHGTLQEEAAGTERGTHYQQTAVLVPGRVEWRPAPLPRPRIDGPQMATVVGPPGEEIHCDEWGRVRVSFPWDRESRSDAFSSCWIRVSQGWAGASWGAMAIPRIGQEVVVQFLDADPDQPLITGRTYRADQLPPYDLPLHKTRMTIKSKTHKGAGFNELRFEDEQGKEEVFVHAQRDMNTEVGNTQTLSVAQNRIEQIGNDQQVQIGNDTRNAIGRNHVHSVGRTSRVEIGYDLIEDVGNHRIESIHADHNVTVGGDSELLIKGHQRISVAGGVNQQTTTLSLSVSERIEFKSPGASLILDRDGITLNGLPLRFSGRWPPAQLARQTR